MRILDVGILTEAITNLTCPHAISTLSYTSVNTYMVGTQPYISSVSRVTNLSRNFHPLNLWKQIPQNSWCETTIKSNVWIDDALSSISTLHGILLARPRFWAIMVIIKCTTRHRKNNNKYNNIKCLGWLYTVYNFRGINQKLELGTEIRWYSGNSQLTSHPYSSATQYNLDGTTSHIHHILPPWPPWYWLSLWRWLSFMADVTYSFWTM